MSYTHQQPAEFSTALIAAAIKEGYKGPLFIQGDHFQVKGSLYRKNPEAALQEVKDLIAEAIPAGFWNIDLDTSTLVTLDPESLDEQQYHNYLRSAELTKFARDLEPDGVTISLGGEIGEVGEKNSTTQELDAYIEGYKRELVQLGDYAGLSKISVQTGTSHGGVMLPDGTMASVAVDFETLEALGQRARANMDRVGLSSMVQAHCQRNSSTSSQSYRRWKFTWQRASRICFWITHRSPAISSSRSMASWIGRTQMNASPA